MKNETKGVDKKKRYVKPLSITTLFIYFAPN